MAECLPRLNSLNPACYGAQGRARFLCKSEAAAGTSAFEAMYRNIIRVSVSGRRGISAGNVRPVFGVFGRRRRTIIITRGNRDSATVIRTTTTRTTTIAFGQFGVLHRDSRRRKLSKKYCYIYFLDGSSSGIFGVIYERNVI